MILSLSCLLCYSAKNEKMFSHSRRGDDHSVCLCLGFKVISSSASEQWSVAGLICKILLLQNVDNSIIYFS